MRFCLNADRAVDTLIVAIIFVGGGIGRLLMDYVALADWGKVASVVLVIMVLVMGLDMTSARLLSALTR